MKLQPLDFVVTPGGSIALIMETNYDGTSASIRFIYAKKSDENHNKVAWWKESELKVIGSLPHLLASNTKHPFGSGQRDADACFKRTEETAY